MRGPALEEVGAESLVQAVSGVARLLEEATALTYILWCADAHKNTLSYHNLWCQLNFDTPRTVVQLALKKRSQEGYAHEVAPDLGAVVLNSTMHDGTSAHQMTNKCPTASLSGECSRGCCSWCPPIRIRRRARDWGLLLSGMAIRGNPGYRVGKVWKGRI